MTVPSFRGVGVAIVTPFLPDFSVDYAALGRIIDYNINDGVDYFIVLGTTGESATLSPDEKNEILVYVSKHVAGRVPLVAGWGGNNTAALLHDIHHYPLQGYSALLSVSPYYSKPTQAGIIAHFTALADAAPLPVMLYNVPGRTAANMTADTTLALSSHKNILGVKEASGNVSQWGAICRARPQGFYCISGDDNLTVPGMSFGMDGVISLVAQAFPRTFCAMVDAALSGDFNTAGHLHLQLFTAMEILFAEGSPAGIKAALHARGLCHNVLRLPLLPATQSLYNKIKAETDVLA